MTILYGKLTTEGDNVYPTLLYNPTLLTLDGEKTGVGKYLFTSNIGLFNNDIPPKWYLADASGMRYVVSQINRTQFEIQVYDSEGSESNSGLSGAEFEINL